MSNYVRTTPLDMVYRGAERDILFEKNEFSLRVPADEQQIRLPFNEVDNNQRDNTNSVSYYETTPVIQESRNENLVHNEFSRFQILHLLN